MNTKILLGTGADAVAAKVESLLWEHGYDRIERARDGHEAMKKSRDVRPDILIADAALPMVDGAEVARVLTDDCICPVLLLTDEAHRPPVNLLERNNFYCLVKPVNKIALLTAVELMVKYSRRERELVADMEKLQERLDTRREVEKAKGLLMKYLQLSESDAFKRMQKQSMDRGVPMKDIAKAIILAYDI